MSAFIKGIFGGGKKSAPAQPAPLKAPEPVAVMPDADDTALKKARSRRIASLMRRSGRQSTMLSEGLGEGLGG